MSNCPRCGSVMDYYREYAQWYCSTCQSYQQPAAAYTPAPPPPPPPQQPRYQQPVQQQAYPQQQYRPDTPPDQGKRGKTVALVIAVAVLAVIIIVSSLLYFTVINKSTSDKDEVTMTMDELRSDYDDLSMTDIQFRSLDPGDTVVVKDEITFIASDRDPDYDEEVTYIWLESAHRSEDMYDWYDPSDGEYSDYDFIFEGDLTDEYYAGDEVSITLHVTKVSYNGLEMETFKEMWGGSDFTPMQVRCMRIIDPWPDDDNNVVIFPTIEVELKNVDGDNGKNDKLTIKHTQGDPLDWSAYKMIITNNTDYSTTTITQLSSLGQQSPGERVQINSSISGFTGLNYEKGKSYQFEIYNLKENKRVFNRENIICE